MGGDLAEGTLAFYRDNGYCVVKDFWTAKECDEFIFLSLGFPAWVLETFAPLMQPHRMHPSFMWSLTRPRLVAILEQLCGGKVSGLQSVWYYGAPGTPGFNAHQDNYFVEAPPDTFVSAWSPMQDTTPEMGGIVGYPGSHKFGALPVQTVNRPGSDSQDPNATIEEVIIPKGYEAIDLVVPKGAVLFMHQNFIHSSNANNTDTFRRALLMTYIRQGSSFRAGNTAKREEVDVYGSK